jgi:hypothetical protein
MRPGRSVSPSYARAAWAGLTHKAGVWHDRARAEDRWPYTTRVLPWGLAAFLAVLCLVPTDAVRLAVNSPIDLTIDRVLLAPLALLWVVTMLTGGHQLQRLRSYWLFLALLLLVAAAGVSIVVNLDTLVLNGEADTAIRRSLLLVGYVLVFIMVATTFRRDEVRALLVWFVLLASITALGTLYEFRFDTNPFYAIADAVLPAPFEVRPAPVKEWWMPRDLIVGPAEHPLSLAVVMSLALPFAVVGLLRYPRGIRNLAYVIALTLVCAGAVASLRKTAVVMPAVAFSLLVLLRPRGMIKLLPLGALVLLGIQVLAPSALGQLNTLLTRTTLSQDASTQGRTADYDAVGPDVWANPWFGRGWGSYEPSTYRFIDNQYLITWIDSGVFALCAYLLVLAAVLWTTKRLLTSGNRENVILGGAIFSAACSFIVCNLLFDTLSFPIAPYIFFYIVGCAAALDSDRWVRVAQPAVPVSPPPRVLVGAR